MKTDTEIAALLRCNIELGNVQLLHFCMLNAEQHDMIRSWRNSPEVTKWMYQTHEIGAEEHQAFVAHLRNTTKSYYWLVCNALGNVGVVYLTSVDARNNNAHFGWYANPSMHVKGKGELLVKSALQIGFHIAGLETMKLHVLRTNEQAVYIYKKCGLQQEGVLRSFVMRDGAYIDVLLMGILRQEYSSSQLEE